MKTLLSIAREVFADLIKLRLPVTALATTTAIVGVLEPLGIDLSAQATRIAGGLAIFGLVIEYGKKLRDRIRARQ